MLERLKNIQINSFWLKQIAIIGMLLQHAGFIFKPYLPFWAQCLLYIPGGLTFPIMAYLVTEGYRKTSNLKRYVLRMLVFAVITQGIYMWALQVYMLNILFTLVIGIGVLWMYDHMKNRKLFYLYLIVISFFSMVCDWPIVGVLLIFFMYMIKGNEQRVIWPILGVVTVMFAANLLNIYGEYNVLYSLVENLSVDSLFVDRLPDILFYVGSLLAIPLLLFYNGERGTQMKYFFYIFYPAHLLVLAILRGVIFGAWGFPTLF